MDGVAYKLRDSWRGVRGSGLRRNGDRDRARLDMLAPRTDVSMGLRRHGQ